MQVSDKDDATLSRAPTPQMTRRSVLLAMTSLAGGLLLTACDAGAPSQRTSSTAVPIAPAAAGSPVSVSTSTASNPSTQPRTGGILRHAIPADITTLEPSSFTPQGMETSWLVFDRLTIYDQSLKPQPMLAESWDVNPDYTQFKLNLRRGVQFHTGRELTSDDIKYTLLRVRDPKVTTGALAAVSNWFSAIDTPDKYTVMLKADVSRPAFFDGLEILNIVDKDTAEGPDGKSRIVGTGPFSFVEWAQGDHFTVTRNTNYWQAGRPYLDGVVTSVRNQSTMALQLVGGNLDSLRTPAIDDYVKLKADPNYVGLAHPNPGTILEIGMNAKRKPFDDKRVRQAMNYAMNRQRFADTAFNGIAQPISLPWMPGAPAFDQARSGFFTYDLDKARALLKEAGVTNLEMNAVISTAQPALQLYMQVLQTDLASIGVKLTIKSVEQAVWADLLTNKKPEHDGFWGGNDSLTNVHPAGIFTSPGWRTANNHSNFESDEWSKLVATVSTETDPARQKAAFNAMNDFLLDQAFTTAATTNPISILTSKKVHDIGYLMHLGGMSFTNAWIEA